MVASLEQNRPKEFRKTPLPKDLAEQTIALSDNARTVLTKRYLRKDEDGQPAESIQEMFWRVAYHVALADQQLGSTAQEVETIARRYYDLLTNLRFFPNSPTFTGAGTPLGQLAACFVLGIDDDMGRSGQGIFETLRNAALIQQTGGGNGFSFSRLRPKGAIVKSSNGAATGPVGFLRVYDQAFGEIAQGGCLTPDTLVFTERGLLRLDEIITHTTQGWQPHELHVPTDEGLRASYQRYNNGVSDVLKVKTDAGLELTGTPNHKLKIFTQDGPVWKRFDELQAGDALMVKLGQHMGQMQTLIHPRKQHGNQMMPIFPATLDEELGFFLGYLMGDGFIASGESDHRIGVAVAHSSYLMDEMPALIGRLFGQHLTIHKQQKPDDASVTYVIDNHALKDFLGLNGFDKPQSRLVRVPRLIRQSPPHIVAAFIRGLFEAEGALSHGYPQLLSSSEALIREVAVMLIGLGCPVRIRQDQGLWALQIQGDFSQVATQPSQALALGHTSYQVAHRVSAGYAPFAEHVPSINDTWFLHISAIEDAGQSLTLDMEVEGNHTYLANGVVSHNSRRGANMAVLRIDHPDVRDFIQCKAVEGAIENFNISVGITDAFMQAVETDSDFDLINPQDGTVWETVRARELFDMVIQYAYRNGEPGVLFLDAANRENPVPHLYELESTNPCFIGETRIATEFGLVRADELADWGQPLFVASDNRIPANKTRLPQLDNLGIALQPASPMWMTRQSAPVMTLTTKGGFQITATPDHKIATAQGYIELQNLKAGDQILLQSAEGAWSRDYSLPNRELMREKMAMMAISGDHASGHTVQRQDFQNLYANLPETWSHSLGLVMGWLVGDGWLSGRSGSPLGMVFGDGEMQALIRETMAEWFGSGHLHERGQVQQLTYGKVPYEFFRSLGVSETRAHQKRVPDALWKAPREAIVGFLQGLFSADGTVHLKGLNHDCTIRLASSSPELLRDVQTLLSNFGIVGRIYLRRKAGSKLMPDGNGGRKEYAYKAQYELIIGRANRDRFTEMIGFADPHKQAKVQHYLDTKLRPSNPEPFSDPVLNIIDAGSADVFDLTQYNTHNLIGNSICISNCGEQFLGPFENCCLGSVNLAQHIRPEGGVDWKKLQESVELSTRFLDHVVTANAYVPAVPELREAAERVRRIGLGIMGLGDLMYASGVRYGSLEGQEFASQIMEFVRYYAMKTSIELAKQHGAFSAIEGSRYDRDNLQWTIPQPIVAHISDWGRPKLDWKKIEKDLKKHGIRNGAQLTVAPTGTIATVSGCEGYGCEPVFALAYVRYMVNNAGNSNDRQQLQYTSPLFEKALQNSGLSESEVTAIIEQVNESGTCQNIAEVPEDIRRVFVVAGDISAEEHIRMQAALQAWTDNAISKTCNFPASATEQDVADVYFLGWKLGCKGLTVYVTGSRDKVVLETKETLAKKQAAENAPAPQPEPIVISEQPMLFNEDKKSRARSLAGRTYRTETPAGTTYITVNENGYGEGQPFEIFIHTAKSGSEIMAIAEAMGRLMSYVLRMSSNVSPRKRLLEMVRQLNGIGGGTPTGWGPNRVRSLPDGVSQVLAEYLADSPEETHESLKALHIQQQSLPLPATVPQDHSHTTKQPLGDICPSCGAATLVNEEGCQKCYSCGFSKC